MNPKAAVRRSFARAAQGYDAVARFQRDTGEALLAGFATAHEPAAILDVGSGTGHGSLILRRRWPRAEICALDFALGMLAHASSEARSVCADAEQLPLGSDSFDLYWSNLTLQWCDPRRFAWEAARVLRPGGQLAVSTLGPATFGELREAFAAADAYRHTNNFCEAGELREAFIAAGFKDVALRSGMSVRHHAELGSLLAEVREIGANRVTGANRRTGLMGKAAWRRFAERLDAMRGEAGLPLSYESIFIYGVK